MKHKGFTIVELIVVITAIAILASIAIVSYTFVIGDSMDAKIKSTVKTAGDALTLYENKNGSRVAAMGYFSNPNGMDTLVPTYLKAGYRDGIKSRNATQDNQIFRWYNCPDASSGFVIYASLNNPTADDIATFQKIRTSCGHTATQAPGTGNPSYNYAQTF
jgi:prepilin-type N-terminal cleavage/methylation domain-containing protein